MVLTASTPFSVLVVFCSCLSKVLVMTTPNVLPYGVLNDRITNVFNDFSSYLTVFIIL